MGKYFIVAIYVAIFGLSFNFFLGLTDNSPAGDQSGLMTVKMKTVKTGDSTEELKNIIFKANAENDSISIAGMQHSQGGQTLYPKGILLDMKAYNKILSFDKTRKTITVQSGAAWADIQEYINPYGLALKVSQSQNIFTVGGSLSVHAHGLDIRQHALIDTVDSFRLLTANGEILTVSRDENEELFPLVIGGYGLFGVILDVTLTLTNDELYEISTKTLQYDEYTSYFTTEVLPNSKKKNASGSYFHFARDIFQGNVRDELCPDGISK